MTFSASGRDRRRRPAALAASLAAHLLAVPWLLASIEGPGPGVRGDAGAGVVGVALVGREALAGPPPSRAAAEPIAQAEPPPPPTDTPSTPDEAPPDASPAAAEALPPTGAQAEAATEGGPAGSGGAESDDSDLSLHVAPCWSRFGGPQTQGAARLAVRLGPRGEVLDVQVQDAPDDGVRDGRDVAATQRAVRALLACGPYPAPPGASDGARPRRALVRFSPDAVRSGPPAA